MTTTINRDLVLSYLPKEASQQDKETFIHICERTGLDPVLKQIHAVKRWDKENNRWTITFQTSIDGYRLIAERTGKYAPGREPTYEYDKDNRLVSATSYIKKMTVDGTWHEVGSTAFLDEYAQTKKDGSLTAFWAKMKRLMLAKCAEALALRKAFPDQYTRLYTDDEMVNAITQEQEEPKFNPLILETECKPALQMISVEEAKTLDNLLGDCDMSYQSKFIEFLNKEFKTDNLTKLPKTVYARLEAALLKKKKERENPVMELAHV